MRLVDTNVLVHAYNTSSEQYPASKAWLDGCLSGRSRVGFAWLALVGFVRLTTNPRAMPTPATVDEALDQVHAWLAQPPAAILSPTARHPFILTDLLRSVGTGGNLVNDAHLAALAIEHRAEVVTFDTDFDRFPGVRWSRPTA